MERSSLRQVLALVLMFGISIFGGPAMAIEQPKYDVQIKDGDFEIRRYHPYVVAEVVVSGDQGEAVRKGFRKLAGYIFGANHRNMKIAMTAPVAQRPVGEKIEMTSPVTQAPASPGRWTVQFMMPAAYSFENLPQPNDSDIHFRVQSAREMAVLTFSGVAREQNYREKTEVLRRWLSTRRLTARGSAVLAQYDPPWIPWFMRRNEVLLEVAR
jgi:hypothetical protein